MTRQVVVVDGLRTPFQKMGTGFSELSSIDLGAAVVSELLQRTGVSGRQVDRVVYGSVAPNLSGPNIAREVVLDAGLPRNIDAFSVVRACATSYQTAISASQAIAIGEIDCAIAGGADSASDVPISVSKKLAKALIKLNKARTLTQRIKAFSKLSPRDLLPQPPALVERSTGLSMGQSAEQMAQANNISRAAQDEFAHRSHQLAAAAWADGRYSQEVATVFISPTYTGAISVDNMVRGDSNLEAYAKLRPVFDKKHGTITAANSSPLSDGASALLMMNAAKAKADGHTPLATIKSYASTALDPREQMLMGPAYAIPLALERANLKLEDIDLLDIHEAFAAQILSVTQALQSKTFASEKLGRSAPIGKIDWDKFNVMGGSLSVGHPFAATGARQIAQTARELKRRGGGLALCAACAAGGLGAAIVLEVQP